MKKQHKAETKKFTMILINEGGPETKKIPCPKCNGSGKINGVSCSGCGGSGRVRA